VRDASDASPPGRHVVAIGLRGWLLAGATLGVVYGLANAAMDALDRRHALGALGPLHPIVDHVLPILLGMLFGLAVHRWLLREKTAVAEAARAEELALRLQHVERDQAVWVVATATLHDVRTPLHALGLLLEELSDELGDERAGGALVTRARAQASRIERSLRALRELAAEARPVIRAVPVEELVKSVTADLAPLAREAEIALRTSTREPIEVAADPLHLRIALENVIRNAIESTRGHGHKVLVQVLRDGDRGAIAVSDDGPGIPDELRAAVFEPLTTTKEKGLGLGLPVARALVRAMGGELLLAERDGFRTTFELRLSPWSEVRP
jgi:signal transduction histidine kinase